ncbi:MAG: MarR family winged helix-turn-helix transcriptional regulator [Alphaproteobacteria bacterium]|nr:MarR family winged helix-turn-helix transcriptional regulator [Alphaproteobacteria bacterium]MDP6589340.1 MarR family winged helix-turn-helix transcriptional regulator [Alphaproteobacteria bacterium]MDP6819537.1 MarR family winged helix-turn-helix transcriptional regulator [Alphaproteobacteria bacterium]
MAANSQRIESLGASSAVDSYIGLTRLVERLHRRFLDVVKVELVNLDVRDINPVQMLLLSDIDEETSVRDLTRRAYHLGSSISYNLKKLDECGYIEQERSAHDRRSVRVRRSEKGESLCAALRERERGQAEEIFSSEAAQSDLDTAHTMLRRLEQSWYNYVQAGHFSGT